MFLTNRLYVALTAGILTLLTAGGNSLAADTVSREGIPANEVQGCFDDFQRNGYMPVYVKGYVVNGKAYFDLAFEPNRPGVQYELRHMISDADWQVKDNDLRSLGYKRQASNHYTLNGVKYHATLWVKN